MDLVSVLAEQAVLETKKRPVGKRRNMKNHRDRKTSKLRATTDPLHVNHLIVSTSVEVHWSLCKGHRKEWIFVLSSVWEIVRKGVCFCCIPAGLSPKTHTTTLQAMQEVAWFVASGIHRGGSDSLTPIYLHISASTLQYFNSPRNDPSHFPIMQGCRQHIYKYMWSVCIDCASTACRYGKRHGSQLGTRTGLCLVGLCR